MAQENLRECPTWRGYTVPMPEVLLEAGPFAAVSGEGRVLLDGVVVRLAESRLTVLEAPSGGGKSTLLRTVAGLEGPGEAERALAGESYGARALPGWRARVTLLAQDAPVLPGTLEDDLSFPFGHRTARGRRFDRERARELLASVGLGELPLDRATSTLSGGERHRLALARGLLWDPSVLLADEPMSGLDPDTAERCFRLLLDFARRPGHAVLATLHDPARATLADARVRLTGGRLGEVS